MKKIIFGLLAATLITSTFVTPVTVSAQTATVATIQTLSPAQIAQFQQLLVLLTKLRELLIKNLAHQNPPASLIATSTIPRL